MAAMPTLTLPDGAAIELPEGEPVGSALPKGTIAARVDGELRDLSFVPAADAAVEAIDSGLRGRIARAASFHRPRAGPGRLRSLPRDASTRSAPP